jgi:acylphosphatase
MVRRRVIVSGRVQGVFFRDSTSRQAARLGVTGWVRNCDDGTVEAVFEGPEDAVTAAVGFMRVGPPHAAVEHVETFDEPAEGLSGFDVV